MHKQSNRDSRQLKLPIDAVPPLLIAHGLRDAHPFPLAKWHKSEVTRRGGRRVPTAEGFGYPLVEMQPENSRTLIALDLDGSGKFRHADCCLNEILPPGSLAIERIESGNLHLFYFLESPVHWGPGASRKAQEIYARIAEYFTFISGADPSYSGELMRNPIEAVHLDARALDGPCRTHAGPSEPYALLDLLRYVPKGWRLPKVAQTSEGGHLALIKAAAKWYGKPANWYAELGELETKIHQLNESLEHPRPWIKVREIARWMHRKQAARLASGEQQGRLSMMQTGRGIKSGASRRKGTEDRDKAIVQAIESGRSLRDVAREFGLAVSTVWEIGARSKSGGGGVFGEPNGG